MPQLLTKPKGIYHQVSQQKVAGATYTPQVLADFVAREIVRTNTIYQSKNRIRIFDPAIGDGQLIDSLLRQIPEKNRKNVDVYGFETDASSIKRAEQRLEDHHPFVSVNLTHADFLANLSTTLGFPTLFDFEKTSPQYDLIIANPPYVRTQILGSQQSQNLSAQFQLAGRVDLYYAFIAGLADMLSPDGTMGIIVSNRFMSTKSGDSVRKIFLEQYDVQKIWDFGDTKLFDAAVLPAVLIANARDPKSNTRPEFTSIYASSKLPERNAITPIDAISQQGVVRVNDGRIFDVQKGLLDAGSNSASVWRIATPSNDSWLRTVKRHTKSTFRDIGKIRVGVKTTADKVFIRTDWEAVTGNRIPELLRPLITHHVAGQFRAVEQLYPAQILYPHETVQGVRRAVDISKWPNTHRYLLEHKGKLSSREYVLDAGRQWYEIWVPQDPNAWQGTKLVFRDISEKPMFWIDTSGSVVNGDCYWLVNENYPSEDMIWLAAAVANSTFIEAFYDNCFCNKLYAGRRRFITQYVEKFPLPDQSSSVAKKMIHLSKTIYDQAGSPLSDSLKQELDDLTWQAFGLVKKL